MPENRHQRRQNAATEQAAPNAVSPPRKNVSKEEGSNSYQTSGHVTNHVTMDGPFKRPAPPLFPNNFNHFSGLKIIQSYFNGQRTDDPLDFPPLGEQPANQVPAESGNQWNLASQMKNMVISAFKSFWRH